MMATQRDPHGIIPESFPYDTLREAQNDIEPDPLGSKRCPYCESINITPLSSKPTANVSEAWKCKKPGCLERFDDPLPPLKDAAKKERMVESKPLPAKTEQAAIDSFGGGDE